MAKIAVRLPAAFETAGEFIADAQALEAAGADLLVLGEGDLDHKLLLAALAGATSRVGLCAPGTSDRTLDALAPGRMRSSLEDWFEEPFPPSRDAWRERLTEHDRKGSAGVIVAMDARLIDLLRNPDQEDDRSADLQLAQG
jgi:hypothetical protein